MKAIVFEDENDKWRALDLALKERGVTHRIRVASLAEFAKLRGEKIDLCIVDLRMPSVEGGSSISSGVEILTMLEYAGYRKVPVLAITSYFEESEKHKGDFAKFGCLIYDYHRPEEWHRALDVFIAQARDNGRYDFAIFTALRNERAAFSNFVKPIAISRYGMDCWDCDIGESRGTIVLLPRPGLVNATATVARFLAQYSPKVVAMAGICAGVGNNAKLGQLLVTDLCWEYQSGKWFGDAFEAEPYQVGVPQNTRASLASFVDTDGLNQHLEEGFAGTHRPSEISSPKWAVFATGSAVIASERRLESVSHQHRKVAGIDMEIFGFHQAVELSGQNMHAISAKVVVDKATTEKNDDLHAYGCYVSAHFVTEAIAVLLGGVTTFVR